MKKAGRPSCHRHAANSRHKADKRARLTDHLLQLVRLLDVGPADGERRLRGLDSRRGVALLRHDAAERVAHLRVAAAAAAAAGSLPPVMNTSGDGRARPTTAKDRLMNVHFGRSYVHGVLGEGLGYEYVYTREL